MHLPAPLATALERALSAPPPYVRTVATDADGTLWDADVGDLLFLHVAAQRSFRGEGLARLRAYARTLASASLAKREPEVIAQELFAMYNRGEIDVRIMCDLEAETIGDRPVAELDTLIASVAESVVPLVRPDIRALLLSAHAAGAEIHVVTGSLGRAVEATLRRAAIPFDRVTGGELDIRDGIAHATLARRCPLFEEKLECLCQTGRWPAAMGLGDGEWDRTFLREVHVPVLVHPKPALLSAMKDVPRAVVWHGTAPHASRLGSAALAIVPRAR